MKKYICLKTVWLLLVLGIILLPVVSVHAQDETLELNLSRDFGYGGLNGEIQGRFSMRVSGPDSLVEVRFYIDDDQVAVDIEPPYRYQFETDRYSPGTHTLYAVGLLSDGRTIESNAVRRLFVTAEESRQVVSRFLVPLLVIVGIATLGGTVLPLILGRKKEHKPGQYGLAGGAVCPRCELPYSRNVLSPNLLVGKLERCPHCGKWTIAPRAAPSALEAAEARYASEGQAAADPQSEAARLEKQIDDSRYL